MDIRGQTAVPAQTGNDALASRAVSWVWTRAVPKPPGMSSGLLTSPCSGTLDTMRPSPLYLTQSLLPHCPTERAWVWL